MLGESHRDLSYRIAGSVSLLSFSHRSQLTFTPCLRLPQLSRNQPFKSSGTILLVRRAFFTTRKEEPKDYESGSFHSGLVGCYKLAEWGKQESSLTNGYPADILLSLHRSQDHSFLGTCCQMG